MTEEHAGLAAEAYGRFGKGQTGEANLNYGDCFSLRASQGDRIAAPLERT
jgi:uncharacterized protein with PIN domain